MSAVFLWPDLGRQAVLNGTATELDPATSRAAFPTRPRALQQLAWAYEELTPDEPVAPEDVQRIHDAAGHDMPPAGPRSP